MTPTPSFSGQPTISQHFISHRELRGRAEVISKAIATMIAVDLMPISTVEGIGFNNLLKILAPNYKIPSRQTISNRIKLIYDNVRTAINEELKTINNIAFTTDIWTSRKNYSFITVTVHFINDKWELKSVTLSTKEFSEQHSAYNISIKLKDIINEWGLHNKIIACVHDNGRNIKNSIIQNKDVFGYSVSCFAHTLQLAINRGLDNVDEIKNVITRCSKIVGHFKHSSRASTLLRETQNQFNVPNHALMQKTVTRWNSTYFMINRLIEQREPVCAILNNRDIISLKLATDLELSLTQWNMLEQLNKLLEPLEKATTMLSTETYISISLVRPVIFSLVNNFLNSDINADFSVENCKNVIKQELITRFELHDDFDEPKIHHIASFLDPRHKFLNYETLENKNKIEIFVKGLFQKNYIQLSQTPDKPSAMDFLFRSTSRSSLNEFETYSRIPEIDKNEDVLLWWRNNCSQYPTLAKLAKLYLCIPGTSVPSERVFSSGGNIVNCKRNCLSSENVDKLIFLHQNKHYIIKK